MSVRALQITRKQQIKDLKIQGENLSDLWLGRGNGKKKIIITMYTVYSFHIRAEFR